MNEKNIENSWEEIARLCAPFLEKGFAFEYFHQKGGDSSCVYVYRFKKGKNFFSLPFFTLSSSPLLFLPFFSLQKEKKRRSFFFLLFF